MRMSTTTFPAGKCPLRSNGKRGHEKSRSVQKHLDCFIIQLCSVFDRISARDEGVFCAESCVSMHGQLLPPAVSLICFRPWFFICIIAPPLLFEVSSASAGRRGFD